MINKLDLKNIKHTTMNFLKLTIKQVSTNYSQLKSWKKNDPKTTVLNLVSTTKI